MTGGETGPPAPLLSRPIPSVPCPRLPRPARTRFATGSCRGVPRSPPHRVPSEGSPSHRVSPEGCPGSGWLGRGCLAGEVADGKGTKDGVVPLSVCPRPGSAARPRRSSAESSRGGSSPVTPGPGNPENPGFLGCALPAQSSSGPGDTGQGWRSVPLPSPGLPVPAKGWFGWQGRGERGHGEQPDIPVGSLSHGRASLGPDAHEGKHPPFAFSQTLCFYWVVFKPDICKKGMCPQTAQDWGQLS